MDFVLLDVSFLIVHEVNQLPIAALVGLAPENAVQQSDIKLHNVLIR